jgi:hypothetical protein
MLLLLLLLLLLLRVGVLNGDKAVEVMVVNAAAPLAATTGRTCTPPATANRRAADRAADRAVWFILVRDIIIVW